MKSAFKAKYEARLKTMKTEFENKFRKNEYTWKQRFDCHRQTLQKEQLKNSAYEDIIREMSERIAKVERKNKDLHILFVASKQSSIPQNDQDTVVKSAQKKSSRQRVVSFSSGTSEEDDDPKKSGIKEDEEKLRRIERILYNKRTDMSQ